MLKRILGFLKNTKKAYLIAATIAVASVSAVVAACCIIFINPEQKEELIELIPSKWPACLNYEIYEEPSFTDDENRDNNAFNVADFGEQGNNGWFYRYGKATKPTESRQIEQFNGERYFQTGANGLEMKSDFVHTADGVSAILEWRAARKGSVDVKLTYVKNVNGDKNPTYPDGVCIYIYKGEELLETHKVDIEVDKENLLETCIDDLEVEEDESIYFVVDPQSNNAYDGGQLYAAVIDESTQNNNVAKDNSRIDNNANNIEDFGKQGANGWYYMFGKDVESSELVSSETDDGYLNFTSPGLMIKKDFIHPAINDDAIISWVPKTNGIVEIRGKYTKFEQNDGNPDWPDGVIVQAYLNQKLLFEKKVAAPAEGTEEIEFREENVKITTKDKLYFVVSANGNSSYDGGCLDVSIMDRNGMQNEDDIAIDESETRQNFASVKDDFGKQGANGWFYQEGYRDQPFGAYNVKEYVKDDKYVDNNNLEIKRDYVTPGNKGESAVIKWKVAQDGVIKIDASYTKLKNEDKNPSWPDGTQVTLYHNSTKLISRDFAADVSKEITKELNVDKLSVCRGDYITMVICGKDNNAYDGGKYTFSISGLSGLVGTTENDIVIENDAERSNNASLADDFGKQGDNGWFYQYGYYNDPFFAVNVEKYEENEKYTTKDGIEIKRDFIMPSTKGKSANVKWKVAQDGVVDVYVDYTKLLNEDANPSWPDGTVVTLMHNSSVIATKSFEPNTKEEIKESIEALDLSVKKGDYITVLVNGKDNTAYDGGLLSFVIEDASGESTVQKNESGVNKANLEADFGEQGSNGWYYLDGRTIERACLLSDKTEDNEGYISNRAKYLEVKKDFVQPGAARKAMYQWIVAQDGDIDVVGSYIKYGQNDPNPSWPDGTKISIYHNQTVIFEKSVEVYQGDGNNHTIAFELEKQNVKKGDKITFVVDGLKNNAWDGGKLSAQIKPCAGEISFVPGNDNDANLQADFGEQGNEGWYYGFGNSSAEFKLADYNNGEYTSALHSGLQLKKDGVQPGEKAGAIYRWIAGKDGKIDLEGAYYKSRKEDPENKIADGVKVEVYKNGTLVDGMSYDIAVSNDEEIVQSIESYGLMVQKGDQLDFIITAKNNSSWDYGKLEMDISSVAETAVDDDNDNERENDANLELDFGEQGSNGWYYLEGKNIEHAKLLSTRADDGGYISTKASGLEVKKDFVQPGSSSLAIYRWIVAQDGEIGLIGSYTKFGQQDSNPSWPDGTKVSIYHNNKLIFEKDVAVLQGDGNNNVIIIDLIELSVKKGDSLSFAIGAQENNAWDGGRLAIQIKPKAGEVIYVPSDDNDASLEADFGEQGSEGWYYGYGNSSAEFKFADYNHGEYLCAAHGGLQLKKDGVQPGESAGAIYRWVVGKDGKIDLEGAYCKSRMEDPENNIADGVKVEVFLNGMLITGMSYDVDVSKTTEITKDIEKSELEVKRGDKLDFIITAKANSSWDYGKLEMNISESGEKEDGFVPATVNSANLFADFGAQGSNGWYYGICDWNGKNFSLLEYDAANNRYYNNGKPELKADFVEPGAGKNAAYKWIAGESGKIRIQGTYTKYPNSLDPSADGVCMRIFQNLSEKKWIGGTIQSGNISSDATVDIDVVLEVERGDEILFAVSPEGNDSFDGGKLDIQIDADTRTSGYTPALDNEASLKDDFGIQGNEGWYYGICDWNGENFSLLEYDAANNRYYNNGKPELKADFVEPGAGKNAAYKWIAGESGKIRIQGTYTKYPNSSDPSADGVCMRIFQNLHEEKWIGGVPIQGGNISSDATVDIDVVLDVERGDEIIFAVSPEGNDSYDGGKLDISISKN